MEPSSLTVSMLEILVWMICDQRSPSYLRYVNHNNNIMFVEGLTINSVGSCLVLWHFEDEP